MNQYICRVCKGNECTVLTSQGPPNCGCLHNSDIGALWEQDSSYKSEREKVLDELILWMEYNDDLFQYVGNHVLKEKVVAYQALRDHLRELRQAGEP